LSNTARPADPQADGQARPPAPGDGHGATAGGQPGPADGPL